MLCLNIVNHSSIDGKLLLLFAADVADVADIADVADCCCCCCCSVLVAIVAVVAVVAGCCCFVLGSHLLVVQD